MSVLRVAIVTPGTFAVPSSSSSSVETVVDEVSRRLAETGKLELYIYGKKTAGMPSIEEKPGITYFRPSSLPGRRYFREVDRSLTEIGPDIIQVENRPRFVPRLRRNHPNSRVLLSLHSITYISKPHISPKQLRICLKQAHAVIVNSEFLRGYVVKRFPFAAGKLHVHVLGVNLEQFPSRFEGSQPMLRELHRAAFELQGRKVILFIGRLIRIKGVHHLLRMMPLLIRRHPDVVLLVVGSAFYGSHRTTPYARRLLRMGRRYRAHVRFVPYVPHDEIGAYYQIADMLAVPSGRNEAFGLVNVEAMATGLPVIAAKAGGIREVVANGRTGILVGRKGMVKQLAAAAHKLMQDELLCEAMGRAGAEEVRERFTWKRTADRWLSLYEAEAGQANVI